MALPHLLFTQIAAEYQMVLQSIFLDEPLHIPIIIGCPVHQPTLPTTILSISAAITCNINLCIRVLLYHKAQRFQERIKALDRIRIAIEAYYAFNFPDVQYLDAEMLYTKAINADKRDYLYSRFGMDLTGYASYYLPILAYHDLWSGISRDSFSYVSRYDEFTESLGQIVVENVEPITVPSYAELPQDGMTEEAAERLDGMVELCEQNGMDVLFIITPMHEAYPYTDAIGEYADSRECGYINFYKIMDDIGLDPATDYYDEAHINLNGSEKISRYLSEYILEHYIP